MREAFLGMPEPKREVIEEVWERQGDVDLTELYVQGGIQRVGELNPYVTLACDLRCNYCYMFPFLQKAKDESELMNRSFFNALLDSVVQEDDQLDRMTFLGGEPTLHPEITSLVNDAADRPIKELRMTTNGVNLHHLDLEKIKSGAFEHVSISIDGTSPEVNDITRGKGTFKRILRTMREYAQARVPLSVNYTVTNHNIDSLNETPDFFRDQGVSILNYHRASMSGNAYSHPELIVGAYEWSVARDSLLSYIDSHSERLTGLTFRVPYIFLSPKQISEMGYVPIQDNNYHSPAGGHRLIVLPPTSKGQGLCYMSSDLIGEPHGELGRIMPDGTFEWNSHPDNELTAFKAAQSVANISTVITGQEALEHQPDSDLVRVSHSFKRTIKL